MNIQTYLEKTGTKRSEFARSIGASANLVYQWINGIRPVATRHCWPIERLTEGKVTRKDLRPDDFADHWPELAGKPTRRAKHSPKPPTPT